jgi:hypothetical protein
MRRILLLTLLVGCTDNADVGLSNQPVQCKPAAAGDVNGTVMNTYTHKSYSFGAPQATATQSPNTALTVALDDSSLYLGLQFVCGQPALGTYDVGGGQAACPLSVLSTVSGRLQQVYGLASSGEVIVDQNVGCIAGRYDLHFDGAMMPNGGGTSGELSGWFSVPVQ